MKKKLAIIGCLLLLLSVVVFGGSGIPAAAEVEYEGRDNTIRVYGEAEIAAEPDVAHIALAVETRSQSASEAAEENARIMNTVRSALQEMGLEEEQLETGTYNIHSYRENGEPARDREEQATYYRAVNELKVTLEELERTGPVIDAAIEAGANQVRSVHFDLQDPAELKLEALRRATSQTASKSSAIAESAGVTIRELKSISEDSVHYAPFRPEVMDVAMEEAEAAPTPITPGDVTVRTRVTAEYRF